MGCFWGLKDSAYYFVDVNICLGFYLYKIYNMYSEIVHCFLISHFWIIFCCYLNWWEHWIIKIYLPNHQFKHPFHKCDNSDQLDIPITKSLTFLSHFDGFIQSFKSIVDWKYWPTIINFTEFQKKKFEKSNNTNRWI